MNFNIGEIVKLTKSLTFAGKVIPAGTKGIITAQPINNIYEVDFEDHLQPIPVHESSLAGCQGLEGEPGTDSGGKPPAYKGLEGNSGADSGGKPPRKDSGGERELSS